MKPDASEKPSILIVDDELPAIRLLQGILGRHSLPCLVTQDGIEALRMVGQHRIPVVLLDLRMERIGGMEILRQLMAYERPPRVIMLTGFGTIDLATQALKLGAQDFLTKPIDFDRLIRAVREALIDYGTQPPDSLPKDKDEIIGENRAFRESLGMLELAADSDLPVLLVGETGTGKELFAQRLHLRSARKTKRCVSFNCSNLPESLIANELFGHEKGAYTGADETKQGLFQEASGGTLFLDEVDSLSSAAQAALLRVLDTGEIRRVGGEGTEKIDVRLVAAVQRPLSEYTEFGEFREDLYFRLRGIEVTIPPLRSRLDDLPLLIDLFRGGKELDISDAAMEALRLHSWPGNVRELRQVIERAMVLCRGDTVLPSHLLLFDGASTGFRVHKMMPLSQMTQEYIIEVVQRHQGNISAAAKTLMLARKTLYRKLKDYGVDTNELRP